MPDLALSNSAQYRGCSNTYMLYPTNPSYLVYYLPNHIQQLHTSDNRLLPEQTVLLLLPSFLFRFYGPASVSTSEASGLEGKVLKVDNVSAAAKGVDLIHSESL